MDYSHYEFLLVETDAQGICTVTLNNPDKLNVYGGKIIQELEQIWVDIAHDEAIKVVIVTGAGRAFSAGGDIRAMADRACTRGGVSYSLRVPGHTRRGWQNMLEVEVPIIGAINGDAMGYGASLALMCDTTVISETAKFGDTHVKIGVVAGDGGAVIWPLLVGPNVAKDFLMRGKVIRGKEACEMRLINYCVPAEDVLTEARKIAEELAALPTWGVRWTKVSINKQIRDQLNLVLDASIAYEMLTMQTQDFWEATNAFADKRKPSFTGE